MKRISSIIVGLVFLFMTVGWLTACRAVPCQKMSQCCQAIKDYKGVGAACGEMAHNLKDPDTCRVVLKTARLMLKKQNTPLPKACQPNKK